MDIEKVEAALTLAREALGQPKGAGTPVTVTLAAAILQADALAALANADGKAAKVAAAHDQARSLAASITTPRVRKEAAEL